MATDKMLSDHEKMLTKLHEMAVELDEVKADKYMIVTEAKCVTLFGAEGHRTRHQLRVAGLVMLGPAFW